MCSQKKMGEKRDRQTDRQTGGKVGKQRSAAKRRTALELGGADGQTGKQRGAASGWLTGKHASLYACQSFFTWSAIQLVGSRCLSVSLLAFLFVSAFPLSFLHSHDAHSRWPFDLA